MQIASGVRKLAASELKKYNEVACCGNLPSSYRNILSTVQHPLHAYHPTPLPILDFPDMRYLAPLPSPQFPPVLDSLSREYFPALEIPLPTTAPSVLSEQHNYERCNDTCSEDGGSESSSPSLPPLSHTPPHPALWSQ